MSSRYSGLVAGGWMAVDGVGVGRAGASVRVSTGPVAVVAAVRRADEER
jgi:hypothetical protein